MRNLTLKLKVVLGIITEVRNFPTFIADYLGLIKRGTIIYHMRNGVNYKVRSGTRDWEAIAEIYGRKVYTPDHFEIKGNDIVLDIGAHVGIFAVLASKIAKNGKIFAFEPIPETFSLLKANLSANNASNVVPINVAVSDKDGAKSFFINVEMPIKSSLFDFNDSRKITVRTVSLENFMKKNGIRQIDFLKMDCEGAEHEILFGCSSDTLKKISKISMEYHDKRTVNRLMTFLSKNGFKVRLKSDMCPMLYAIR